MKSFIQSIQNMFKIKELREKILLTLGLLLVYRVGTYIPLPGINPEGISRYFEQAGNSQNGLLDLITAFTGGAFTKASLLGLGVMPYISASIIVQLMGIAIPYVQKLQNEGESGRRTINQITRWLTILICAVQAPFYIGLFTTTIVPISAAPAAYTDFAREAGTLFYVISTIILTTGTLFTMWLGERITDKGIGNGVSLIIMIGIIATLPQSLLGEYNYQASDAGNGLIFFLAEVVLWLVVVLATVLLVNAIRKVTVQYAQKMYGGGSSKYVRSVSTAVRDYIPLKVNAAGVMPIIFAQMIVMLPIQLIQSVVSDEGMKAKLSGFASLDNFWYNFSFALLIIIFTFFYTAITIPVNQIAEGLKKSGGFVPGVKPGLDTAHYLDDILSKITFPGALFLALIAILPGIVMNMGVQQNFALFFGGTSLIILVGVAVDTIQQINAYLLNHHYDGLLETGKR